MCGILSCCLTLQVWFMLTWSCSLRQIFLALGRRRLCWEFQMPKSELHYKKNLAFLSRQAEWWQRSPEVCNPILVLKFDSALRDRVVLTAEALFIMWPVVMRFCDPESHEGLYWKSEQPLSQAVIPLLQVTPTNYFLCLYRLRCAYALSLAGEGSDCPGCFQGTARSRPQLLQSQGQVQCQQGRQHDHPVHCSVGSAWQGHQHFLHACAVRFLFGPKSTQVNFFDSYDWVVSNSLSSVSSVNGMVTTSQSWSKLCQTILCTAAWLSSLATGRSCQRRIWRAWRRWWWTVPKLRQS